MGQLEKYGLYVLCLVIFLILGVAMWGESPPDALDADLAQQQEALPALEPDLDQFLLGQEQQAQRTLEKQRRAEELFAKPVPAVVTDLEEQIEPPVQETTAPGAAARTQVALRTYKVVRGDTLGAIALSHLGRASLSSEIEKANPGIDPNNLRIGMELTIPDVADSQRTQNSAAPRFRTYTVRDGDSLWEIASRHYGANRADTFVKRIRQLNNLRGDLINPGDEIKLPIE